MYLLNRNTSENFENEKFFGNTSRRRVFAQLFQVLPNFCDKETQKTCFYFCQKTLGGKMKATCLRHHFVNSSCQFRVFYRVDETRFLTNRRGYLLLLFFKCYSIQRGFRDKVISYFLALCINNDEFKRGNTPYLVSSIQFIVLSQHKNVVLPRHLINLLPSRIFQFSFLTLFSYFSNFLAVVPISFGQCCIRLTS